MIYFFAPQEPASIAINGSSERTPVQHIFCISRNYAAHAREMGKDPDRDLPFFFLKPADAMVDDKAVVPYPPETENFYYEPKLVFMVGKGGRDIAESDALDHAWGYAVGNDLTRGDLQLKARAQGRPWDLGKGFDLSAPVAAAQPAEKVWYRKEGFIKLTINREVKQEGNRNELI